MLNTVRAVVKGGRIELLEEIYIPEGTQVLVTILADKSRTVVEFQLETGGPLASAKTDVTESIHKSFEDKFSESGKRVLHRAIKESRARDHNFLSATHIFVAIKEVENELFTRVMQAIDVDPDAVSELLEQELAKRRRHVSKKLHISDSARNLFNRSLKRARLQGRQTIDAYDLFFSLFADPTGAPAEALRRLGADPSRLTDSA
jgi:hypothetical protein